MNWQEKAKLAMRVKGITQEKLAAELGVSQGGLGHWLNRRREPSLDVLEKMAKKLDYEIADFIADGKSPVKTIPFATPTKEHRIPVIGMAQLGDGGHWLAYDHPDSYVQWYSDDPNAYAVQGIGDSMQPRIKHKEFVIIEPNHPIMNGDEVFVVTVDERRMVKIYSYTKDDRIHLESENQEHDKIVLDKSEVLFMHYVAGIAKSSKMFV